MACRLADPEVVWLNKVGTFGLGCASYWWGRLFSIVTRTAIALARRDLVFQFLFADDLNLMASGVAGMRSLLVMVFFTALVGTPFSWTKSRGGFEVERVGYFIDLRTHSLGISMDRARWLVDWIDAALANGIILVRDLVAVVGRLSFSAGPLERLRPFLAPIYSWVAVVPAGACLPPPVPVKLALIWIAHKLRSGGRTMPCRRPADASAELFRTDAKADKNVISIGGWETRVTTDTSKARWFAIQLTADNAPGLWPKGSRSGSSPLLSY